MPAICRAAYAAAMAAQGRSNQARTRSALGIMHLRLGSRTPATPGAGGPGAGLPDLLQHDLPGKLSRRSAWPGRKGARGGLPQEQSPCLLLRSGTQGSPAPALRHGRPAPGARQCGGPATEQGCRDGGGGGREGKGLAADLHPACLSFVVMNAWCLPLSLLRCFTQRPTLYHGICQGVSLEHVLASISLCCLLFASVGQASARTIASLPWTVFTSPLTHRLVLLCIDAHCFIFWALPGDVLAAPESALGLDRCNTSLSLSLLAAPASALCGWNGVYTYVRSLCVSLNEPFKFLAFLTNGREAFRL